MDTNIKWILFDVSGVITNFTLNKPEGYVVKSRFFNQSDLEGIYSDKNYIHYMLGELSHEQFVGGYLTRHRLDLSVDEFTELFKTDITPMQGMETIFQKVEKKYKIALVTNEGKVFAKYRIEGSGLIPYLSKIIPSYLVHELKPSIQFFKKALSIIDAKPEECVFVDDTPANVAAAQSLGILSMVFTNVDQLKKDFEKYHIV